MKVLTWEQLQKENPKQTAAVIACTWHTPEGVKKRTRVFLGHWMSREEAWKVIYDKGYTSRVNYLPGNVTLERQVRLLRLSKVIADLDQRRPKDTSAILL